MIGCLFAMVIILGIFFLGGAKLAGIIIILALLFGLPYSYIKSLIFRLRAVKMEAVVVDCEIIKKSSAEPSRKYSTNYYPILEYIVPEYGLVRTGGYPNGVNVHSKPNVGDKVTIYYNPKSPKDISLPNKRLEVFLIVVYLFFAFMILRYTFDQLGVNIL